MAPFLVFVLGCVLSASVAAPVSKILEYDAGTHSRYEAGVPGQSVTGSYSWQDGEQIYRMDYVADENGYRPVMKVTRIGSPVKVQPEPYLQQVFVPVIPEAPAPVVPVAPPAPVQQSTKIIQAVPEPVVVKVEVAPAQVVAEPAKVEEPVKLAAAPAKVEAEPVQASADLVKEPEGDDDAIQVTAEASATGDEPDQLKGTFLMNAIAQEYEQQLLQEQQYLQALKEAQQDNRPSSYSLSDEEEAELTLLQLMAYEQQFAKDIEQEPQDQAAAVRLALEYEQKLAREFEQQAFLRQLAEAELLGGQKPQTDDVNAYLRQLFDYEAQQQLLAQLAGADPSSYLRYNPDVFAQQSQPSESVDGATINARELSDYEKALEALYFGGQ